MYITHARIAPALATGSTSSIIEDELMYVHVCLPATLSAWCTKTIKLAMLYKMGQESTCAGLCLPAWEGYDCMHVHGCLSIACAHNV